MDKDLLELYSDYLLSSFSHVTATGLSQMTGGEVSHDRITRFPTFQSVVLVHNLDGAHGGRGWLSCVCRSMAREELPLGPTGPPDR